MTTPSWRWSTTCSTTAAMAWWWPAPPAEGATLTDDEKVRIWELAVAEAGGAPVIAGTGTYDTAHSVNLTEKATETGVDGVLVVTPYYNKPNRRGLRAHFEAVAAATNLPVVLYNIPGRSVIDLPERVPARARAGDPPT